MLSLNTIEKKDLKELLNQSWMTHDAMWFKSCVEKLGIERANELNLSAVRSAARIEAIRLKKILGIGRMRKFEDLKSFLESAIDLTMPDFMKFEFSFPDVNSFQYRWKDEECFAYRGVGRLGVAQSYECGVIPRIIAWLEALKVSYSLEGPTEGCMMQRTGGCGGVFRFEFPE